MSDRLEKYYNSYKKNYTIRYMKFRFQENIQVSFDQVK